MNRVESTLVSEVKEKQYKDPILLELKENVLNGKIMTFEQGRDGLLKYKRKLCVPKVDNLQ